MARQHGPCAESTPRARHPHVAPGPQECRGQLASPLRPARCRVARWSPRSVGRLVHDRPGDRVEALPSRTPRVRTRDHEPQQTSTPHSDGRNRGPTGRRAPRRCGDPGDCVGGHGSRVLRRVQPAGRTFNARVWLGCGHRGHRRVASARAVGSPCAHPNATLGDGCPGLTGCGAIPSVGGPHRQNGRRWVGGQISECTGAGWDRWSVATS